MKGSSARQISFREFQTLDLPSPQQGDLPSDVARSVQRTLLLLKQKAQSVDPAEPVVLKRHIDGKHFSKDGKVPCKPTTFKKVVTYFNTWLKKVSDAGPLLHFAKHDDGWILVEQSGDQSTARPRARKPSQYNPVEDTYDRRDDVRFMDALKKAIQDARSEITFVGIACTFLHNRDELHRLLKDKSAEGVAVRVLLADGDSQAVQQRYLQEKEFKDMDSDESWATQMLKELTRVLKDSSACIHCLSFVPMMCVIRIDKRLFFYPYGSPAQVRGSSPIVLFACNQKTRKSPWVQFLCDYVDTAVNDIALHPASAKTADSVNRIRSPVPSP